MKGQVLVPKEEDGRDHSECGHTLGSDGEPQGLDSGHCVHKALDEKEMLP